VTTRVTGDCTWSLAHFTGTMTVPDVGGLDAEIPRAACPSRSASATVARGDNGEIDEEIFYDLVTIMRQIGLSD
jgi:hypothetical protein